MTIVLKYDNARKTQFVPAPPVSVKPGAAQPAAAPAVVVKKDLTEIISEDLENEIVNAA